MPARCVVAGCSNTSKDGVSLHRFPKAEKLRNIWTSKVKLTRGKWPGPSATSLICSDHFSLAMTSTHRTRYTSSLEWPNTGCSRRTPFRPELNQLEYPVKLSGEERKMQPNEAGKRWVLSVSGNWAHDVSSGRSEHVAQQCHAVMQPNARLKF